MYSNEAGALLKHLSFQIEKTLWSLRFTQKKPFGLYGLHKKNPLVSTVYTEKTLWSLRFTQKKPFGLYGLHNNISAL